MGKIRKNINVEVDMRLLEIGEVKEERKHQNDAVEDNRFSVSINEDNNIRNISIKHALTVLTQQMKLNGLRKRTI